jgi:hypothetical protein
MQQRTGLDLNMLVVQRLGELPRSASGIIRFPAVFEKLCRNFSINKKQCWELLFILKEQGHIKIVPYQGVKLLS